MGFMFTITESAAIKIKELFGEAGASDYIIDAHQ